MLIQIHISNLITIDQLNLEFTKGTTVLTGETGTGKSILIDAIELALGARVTSDIVRPGQERADITLHFDINDLQSAKEWLKHFDLNADLSECIIRRSISKDNRSRSYINGIPVTLQMVRELSELLIDIHGQHEHHALLKSERQRDMLDDFANHATLKQCVSDLAFELTSCIQKMESLRKNNEERLKQVDFLSFQRREFEDLKIASDEFQILDLEHKQLSNADSLLKNIQNALHHLTEQENQNVIHLLNQVVQTLAAIQEVNPLIATWVENLKTIIIQLNDIESDLYHYLSSVEIDPSRLNFIENRLSSLFNLARKYKISPAELNHYQQKISDELNELENGDEHLKKLEEEINVLKQKYEQNAKKLSDSRKKAATCLSKEITAIIRELGMPKANFQINFEAISPNQISSHGLEKIIFEMSSNPGLVLQPLTKIASGGELSRISLAIHVTIAERYKISTLIFDEVDVGISGRHASIVGKLLRHLGRTHQVFCVTHLPQVASQGNQHIRVEKINDENSTYTKIQSLSSKEKINEIARMLGGVTITQTTIEHAREMLDNVES